MWPFHLMHTAMSGAILINGFRRYVGPLAFIDQANELEIAGAAMLAAAFGYGVLKLFQEIKSWLTQFDRPKVPKNKPERKKEEQEQPETKHDKVA